MNILITGGGKPLQFLCRRFLAKSCRVTIVDQDPEECGRLSRQLRATVVLGDGTNPLILDEAGVREADVVLAATPHDADNLIICQLATRCFSVPHVVAVVNDPENETTFRDLGVNAFSATRVIAGLIEQRTAFQEITNLIPLGEGRVIVTELRLRDDMPAVYRSLSELDLPPDVLVACLVREGRAMIPRGGTELLPGDQVMVISLPENHGPALRAITGERNEWDRA